ncbi:GntR family transcriptional regulator [Mangrovicoccus sp. HB161399]|uniref:GntR family transcriptional regulator n=1 Tax=Mangrovicoccus sp. HB161399 TaxID=2720392 RepID=UPI001556FC75|nr:GntR family transcriptional regulator [Mangrovicoccus sp. HB161399]
MAGMTTAPEQIIVDSILDAIANHKLRAGTKLGEHSLSEIFSCNRTQVRRALATLTGYQVVEHIPNRGAFVTTPSERDARDVFQARQAIELTICGNVVQFETLPDFPPLHENIGAESRAIAAGNRAETIRLSRKFHLILAELGGNSVLERYLEELTMRSSLILGLYGGDTESQCASDDHCRIVAALEARDGAAAQAEMRAHLQHIEAEVDFTGARKPTGALSSLLL